MSVQILPPAVTGLNARYFGDSGGTTARYYWVRANYPSGQSVIAGPAKVTTPASLSKNNEVLIIWNPAPGAMSYDVLQTTTAVVPTVSAAVLNAAGIDRNSYVDQGDTLATYVPFDSGVGPWQIQTFHAIFDFTVDGGLVSTITPAKTALIPANAIMVGGVVNVTVAVTSAGAATVGIGTSAGSSTTALLAATAKTSLTVDALLALVPTFAAPVKMTAAGSITFTVGTAVLTAGQIEVFVSAYVPAAA